MPTSFASRSLAGSPSRRRIAPGSTTSATARSRPRCTTRCRSTPRSSSPRQRRPPGFSPRARQSLRSARCPAKALVHACMQGRSDAVRQGRVQRLPRMRHSGARLPGITLRRLRPNKLSRVTLQAAQSLHFARCPAHGTDRDAPCGPRPPARTGVHVGAVSADHAAPAAGRTTQAGGARAAGRAPRHHAVPARSDAGHKADEACNGEATLIQHCGSVTNLNIHLQWLGGRRVPTPHRRGAGISKSPRANR